MGKAFTMVMIYMVGLCFNQLYAKEKFSLLSYSFANLHTSPQFEIKFSCPISFSESIDYGALFWQSTLFLGLENGVRLEQEKTMSEVQRGEFFPDWFNSVKSFHGWSDGNKIFTNWVAHPMQGSVSAFIFANNDNISKRAKFGMNSDYFSAKKGSLFLLLFIASLLSLVQFLKHL